MNYIKTGQQNKGINFHNLMDPNAWFWQTIIMNNHNFTYHNIYLRNFDRSWYGNFYTEIKYKTQMYIPIDLVVLSLYVQIFGDLIFFYRFFTYSH